MGIAAFLGYLKHSSLFHQVYCHVRLDWQRCGVLRVLTCVCDINGSFKHNTMSYSRWVCDAFSVDCFTWLSKLLNAPAMIMEGDIVDFCLSNKCLRLLRLLACTVFGQVCFPTALPCGVRQRMIMHYFGSIRKFYWLRKNVIVLWRSWNYWWLWLATLYSQTLSHDWKWSFSALGFKTWYNALEQCAFSS